MCGCGWRDCLHRAGGSTSSSVLGEVGGYGGKENVLSPLSIKNATVKYCCPLLNWCQLQYQLCSPGEQLQMPRASESHFPTAEK